MFGFGSNNAVKEGESLVSEVPRPRTAPMVSNTAPRADWTKDKKLRFISLVPTIPIYS